MSDEIIPAPTQSESGVIKSINPEEVHKICSGQVIVTLAIAVKELVENALDAGAKCIEVKLKDKGLESVEVSDDGCGVKPNQIEAMTAKYHTSKICEFEDLLTVKTFGFRGEALSSLCSLAHMQIITRHKDHQEATKIELDHKGDIKTRTICSRSPGTTVLLNKLFQSLPVRRRDFERNIKKEFTKMCYILQAYCLVSIHTRIRCSNQTTGGNSAIIMMTQGNQNVLNNIYAIFGKTKQGDIVQMKSPLENDQGCTLSQEELWSALQELLGENNNLCKDDLAALYSNQFKLDGYISSCAHGCGRSSKDRQFFYVNSRPCDLKNVAKIVNDYYHSYNAQQYPFVYLNIITKREDVDVNLTPDKRQLLLTNEKLLLALIRRALHMTFGQIPSTYKLQNTITNMINPNATSSSSAEAEKPLEEIDLLPLSTAEKFHNVLSQWKRTGDTIGKAPKVPNKRKYNDEIQERTVKLQKIQEYFKREEATSALQQFSYKSDSDDSEEDSGGMPLKPSPNKSLVKVNVEELHTDSKAFDKLMHSKNSDVVIERIYCKVTTPSKEKQINLIEEINEEVTKENGTRLDNDAITKIVELDKSDTESDSDNYKQSISSEWKISLKEIEEYLKAEDALKMERQQQNKLNRLRFKSLIKPSENKTAETELQTEIKKSDFSRMNVLGQFNLGFIICQLDSDLFIVDQHASDEKYNYEMLQRNTQLSHQPLAVPQPLELTAVNEMILLDHLDVFEKNGFKFSIDYNASPCKKISLLGKPTSHNWEFGKGDIDELIFMLQDAPEGTICRPSRVKAMFASRACRQSVMIGTALKVAKMQQLIQHMGEMEHPWNCPHGRPTMRHLINTALLTNDDDDCTEGQK